MASLPCPLCCSERFSSHLELNNHILGMIDNIDNLYCPSCKEPCEDLVDLADHLAKECVNLPTSTRSESADIQVKIEPPDGTIPDNVNESTDATSTENAIEVNNVQDEPTMIYSCDMCNMSFASVEEHLSEYHYGEEVLLETEEVEDELAVIGADETDVFHEDNVDALVDDTAAVMDMYSEQIRSASEDHLDDVEVREDLLEMGDESVNDIEPRTTKYLIEDGKITTVNDEEAALHDKGKIFHIYNCSNCKLKFPYISHYNRHKCALKKKAVKVEKRGEILKIKEGLRYQCTFCQTAYSCLISLNDHMKSHLIEDQSGMVQKKAVTMTLHQCNICNTKFPTFKQLRLHLRMHDPVKAKKVEPPVSYNMMGQSDDNNQDSAKRAKFECPICGKEYDKGYEEVHMKSHEENQFTCVICNRKFELQENLTLHIKAHSNNKKFLCSYCKKPFQTYEALEQHVIKKCQRRDFECQYCGRRFSRPHEKVKHERIHTGEKPHICEICGKSFRIGYCLTLHMRTHTGNRPYTCDHCGKRFKSCSVFNHHLKTHSEDRNYKCPYCPKAFKTAVQIAGHKNSHTKPFACTECNRPFASLYAVRAHMDTHSRKNNLKHECWVCGASYARSFALRDHINEVHADEEAARNNEQQDALETEDQLGVGNQSASEEVGEENQYQQISAECEETSQDQEMGEEANDVYEIQLQDENDDQLQESVMQ